MGTIIHPATAHQRPSGKLYLGSEQTNIASGTITVVTLDTIPAGFGDAIENTGNHRITPGKAGIYAIMAQVFWKNIVVDKRYDARIYLNGSTFLAIARSYPATSGSFTLSCGIHAYLSATDYVDVRVLHYALVDTVDINDGVYSTFLSVQRVR